MQDQDDIKKELKHIVWGLAIEGATAHPYETSVTFETEGIECSIYTDVSAVLNQVTKDAEGNEYVPLEVRVTVSEPTVAVATPKETIARLQFGLKVAQLAQSIVDHFAGRDLRYLICSADGVPKKVVWAFCIPHIKGMRVNQVKPLNKPPQFLDGEYHYEVLGKTYCVKIVLDAVFITRTK